MIPDKALPIAPPTAPETSYKVVTDATSVPESLSFSYECNFGIYLGVFIP